MQRLPVWPMAAGVAVAMLVLEGVALWLRPGTLPRVGLLFVLAAALLFTAAMISGFVARTIYARVAHGMQGVSALVTRAACLVALWVPAWVLFMETSSLLMVLAACVCLASLGVFLKRCAGDEIVAAGQGEAATVKTAPFLLEFPGFTRAMLPSTLMALLAEAAVILMVARWFVSASFAAGAFAAVVGWRAVQRFSQSGASRPILPASRQMAMVTIAFVLTMIALLPYLKVSPFSGGLGMLRAKPGPVGSTGGQRPEASSSDGYVGIVLLAPKEQHKSITLPVKREFTSFGVRLTQPLEIPFDGAYWYFKYPDKAPRPTAKVVKGDAAKVTVRSTDRYPLLMEAHQKLDDAIDLGCCSAINLVVRNADKHEGAIVLELWVRKRGTPATALHYLGTTTIPSSDKPLAMRGPEIQDESVRFPVPPSMDGIQFDEITVVMRGARERAQFGAQVGLRKFVLEP